MDKYRAQELREKSLNSPLSVDDMIEVVKYLRQERVSAVYASKGAKAKKEKVALGKTKKMEENLFNDLSDEESATGEDNDFSL